MTKPTTCARLAAALAAFQAELPQVRKDSKANAGTYSYDYADLEAVSSEGMPLLGKHGLAFLAKPTLSADGRFVLAYSLLHVSGEREDGIYPLPANGSPQQIGSAITYGRRYTFCAVTGIAPGGEDDDGAAAEGAPAPPAERPAPPVHYEPYTAITKPQQAKLGVMFSKLGFASDERDERLAAASKIVGRKLESSTHLTRTEASKLIDTLDRCGTRERLLAFLATGAIPQEAPDDAA